MLKKTKICDLKKQRNLFFKSQEKKMIKETSPKPSPLSYTPQHSPNFSQPLSNPHTPEQQTFQKSYEEDPELKTSKAYINAMKALQIKIKKLESKIDEIQGENSSKNQESTLLTNKLKEKLEEERKIFNNLESNLKNKLNFLESDASEYQKKLEVSLEENSELKAQLLQENVKREQDFKQFLKEKGEYKEKIQVQSNRIASLENLNQTLQEDFQNIRKEKGNLERDSSFLQEKLTRFEERENELRNFFEIEKNRILSGFETVKISQENEIASLEKEKTEFYEEIRKLKVENEELKEKNKENEGLVARLQKELEDYRGKDKEKNGENRSNGKTRFKYYKNIEEKPRELFSWNTPEEKQEEIFEKNLNYAEKFENFKENTEKNPVVVEKRLIFRENGSNLKNQNFENCQNYFEKNKNFEKNQNSEKKQNFEKNQNFEKKQNFDKIQNLEKNQNFLEKSQNFIQKSPKQPEKQENSTENPNKLTKKDDLKENLRQILKNESFSGRKLKKNSDALQKTIDKIHEDSDYDRNISYIIELEKELLELNKVYHDLTEQILVILSHFSLF